MGYLPPKAAALRKCNQAKGAIILFTCKSLWFFSFWGASYRSCSKPVERARRRRGAGLGLILVFRMKAGASVYSSADVGIRITLLKPSVQPMTLVFFCSWVCECVCEWVYLPINAPIYNMTVCLKVWHMSHIWQHLRTQPWIMSFVFWTK